MPPHATMYSTYRKLSSWAYVSTAVVSNVQGPKARARLAQVNMFVSGFSAAPSLGLHLPWISAPLAVVFITYSSASSKSVL